MRLASRPDISSHVRGKYLNFKWFNLRALANVSAELESTSDHQILAGDTLKNDLCGVMAFKLAKWLQVKNAAWEDFLFVIMEWRKGLEQERIKSKEDVENLTDFLFQLFGGEIQAKRNRELGRSCRLIE